MMKDNEGDETIFQDQEERLVANFVDEPMFFFQDIHEGEQQDVEASCGGEGRYGSISCLPTVGVEVCARVCRETWAWSLGGVCGGRWRW